jgi:hypothetical protein
MTKVQKNPVRFTPAALAGLALACGLANPASGQQAQRTVKHASHDISVGGSVAAYAEATQYHPESVPIDASYWDLLHPWSVDTKLQPMISERTISLVQSLRNSGLSEKDVWSRVPTPVSSMKYQFALNKVSLAGIQDELQARLTVTSTQSSDAALRIQVVNAEMIGTSHLGSPDLGAVPFSCEATGPVCTFTWRAPSADKLYWGGLTLQVTITADGSPDQFVLRQPFYSSPMVAGTFTGTFHDRLENGSLVIDAGVDIQRKMACFVTANLYSADQTTPLQHAQRRVLVDPSMKTISFTFFGKIFRDYGDEGAFRLQDLVGKCVNVPYPAEWFMDSVGHRQDLEAFYKNPPGTSEPPQIFFAYNTYSYTTRSYPNSAFSDAEWQSPEKTAKLEMMKKAAAAFSDPAVAAQIAAAKQQALQQLQLIQPTK